MMTESCSVTYQPGPLSSFQLDNPLPTIFKYIK